MDEEWWRVGGSAGCRDFFGCALWREDERKMMAERDVWPYVTSNQKQPSHPVDHVTTVRLLAVLTRLTNINSNQPIPAEQAGGRAGGGSIGWHAGGSSEEFGMAIHTRGGGVAVGGERG